MLAVRTHSSTLACAHTHSPLTRAPSDLFYPLVAGSSSSPPGQVGPAPTGLWTAPPVSFSSPSLHSPLSRGARILCRTHLTVSLHFLKTFGGFWSPPGSNVNPVTAHTHLFTTGTITTSHIRSFIQQIIAEHRLYGQSRNLQSGQETDINQSHKRMFKTTPMPSTAKTHQAKYSKIR